MSETLKIDIQNKVAICTLNRPKKLNALSFELRDALTEALKQCHEDDAVGAIV